MSASLTNILSRREEPDAPNAPERDADPDA